MCLNGHGFPHKTVRTSQRSTRTKGLRIPCRRAAQSNGPSGVAVDSAGNVFVADRFNHTIRKVTPEGVVTTLAGSAAGFFCPSGVGVDSAGKVFVADQGNSTIRKVTSVGVVTTLAGSAGLSGSADGTGSAARFSDLRGVAVDSVGNVFVGDYANQTIRKVTAAGVVTTIGGIPGVVGGADGLGSSANFCFPFGIAVDSAGNLYVADSDNHRITKGTPIYPWITLGFDGTHLQLSWPASYLGWELEAQTNSLGVGLGTNWFPVAGSTTTTQMSIPVDPTNRSVFYRLHYQYPRLTLGFDETHVQLSWPASYVGWELQAQTNLAGAGLGTNWFPVAGSTTTTQMSIPVDPANGSVFYRLHQQ